MPTHEKDWISAGQESSSSGREWSLTRRGSILDHETRELVQEGEFRVQVEQSGVLPSEEVCLIHETEEFKGIEQSLTQRGSMFDPQDQN